MATFHELYRQMNGKAFCARTPQGMEAKFNPDGDGHFRWQDALMPDGPTKEIVCADAMERVNWTLIPPESTVEEVFTAAGYQTYRSAADDCQIVACKASPNNRPLIYIPRSKFPNTPAAARELVVFLDKYR